jgi:DNA-binding CsgD family transcriptional regulator
MSGRGTDESAPVLREGLAQRGRDDSVSLERISDLIGSIYECVLDPRNWEATLASINREFTFASSALGIVPLRARAQTLNVSVGIDPEWLAVFNAYTADSVALWGGAERAQGFPLDEPIVGSHSAGFSARHTNRYFREILEPRGIVDAVMITIAREPSLMGYVAFNRHLSAGDIGEAEVNGLRLLGPHFRRAVTISNLFDMKAIEASTFGSVLDAVAFGVVLVDDSLRIVHANGSAEAMLAAGDPIESQRGTLALHSRSAIAALQDAVSRAAHDEIAMGQKGIGIPASRLEGEPCVIHVLPLRRGEIRHGLVQSAVAAVFVAPATASPSMPTDALAVLYDLTPAEARIFELVCEGLTQAEIADAIGIARSTVKTHLLRVFEKTGCRRQVELVKLAASLSLQM